MANNDDSFFSVDPVGSLGPCAVFYGKARLRGEKIKQPNSHFSSLKTPLKSGLIQRSGRMDDL